MLDFNGYQVSSNGTVRSVSIGDEAEEDPTYYRASYVSDIKNVGGIITYTANRDIYTPGRIINAGETVSDKNELIGKVLYYKRPDQNPTYHDIYVDNNYEGRASRTLYLFNTTDKTLDIIATGECAHGISARENYFEKGDYNDLIYGHQILNLKTASPWIMVEPYTTSDGSKVVDHLLDQSITGGKLVSDEDVYVLNTSDGSIKKLDSGSDLTGYVKSDGQGKDQYAVIHYPAADMTNPGSTGGNTATNTDGVNTFWIQSGAEAGDGIYLTFGRMDTNILGIHGLDVSTGTGASDSIERSKKAVSKLNEIRSNIGAQQNRLEHTIRHQNNTIENTQAAESAIRDTDMAEEMVRFSNENILAQAGQTMLAQANQSKQGIMSLLQ
ncbi:MAG: flagellin [Lachnospiraceae bacterium]|nr:flagellin [Lachnospiraceae bacterium]